MKMTRESPQKWRGNQNREILKEPRKGCLIMEGVAKEDKSREPGL